MVESINSVISVSPWPSPSAQGAPTHQPRATPWVILPHPVVRPVSAKHATPQSPPKPCCTLTSARTMPIRFQPPFPRATHAFVAATRQIAGFLNHQTIHVAELPLQAKRSYLEIDGEIVHSPARLRAVTFPSSPVEPPTPSEWASMSASLPRPAPPAIRLPPPLNLKLKFLSLLPIIRSNMQTEPSVENRRPTTRRRSVETRLIALPRNAINTRL